MYTWLVSPSVPPRAASIHVVFRARRRLAVRRLDVRSEPRGVRDLQRAEAIAGLVDQDAAVRGLAHLLGRRRPEAVGGPGRAVRGLALLPGVGGPGRAGAEGAGAGLRRAGAVAEPVPARGGGVDLGVDVEVI